MSEVTEFKSEEFLYLFNNSDMNFWMRKILSNNLIAVSENISLQWCDVRDEENNIKRVPVYCLPLDKYWVLDIDSKVGGETSFRMADIWKFHRNTPNFGTKPSNGPMENGLNFIETERGTHLIFVTQEDYDFARNAFEQFMDKKYEETSLKIRGYWPIFCFDKKKPKIRYFDGWGSESIFDNLSSFRPILEKILASGDLRHASKSNPKN